LQLLAICGAVGLGGLIWRQSTDNSFIEACVFGMIAFCVFGVAAGLGEFKSAGASAVALAALLTYRAARPTPTGAAGR